MNPCNEPRMSDPAWRAWLARHPHFHAPAIAPCGGSAAHHWLAKAAAALTGTAALGGAAVGAARAISRSYAASALPAASQWIAGSAWAPPPGAAWPATGAAPVAVAVPEPSSLGLMLIALTMLAVVALVARRRA